MGILDGKRGIVFGVANDRSYAWYITKCLMEQGAECIFTHLPGAKMERRVRGALKELGNEDPWLMPCDASNEEDVEAVFAKVKDDFGTIDFLVHSIAFSDREFLKIGNFHTTTRDAWNLSLDVSAYTLISMARNAAPLMTNGGSIVSMSYYGGEKVCPGYNVMGIAKAALEHNTRYLAAELGRMHNVRVNCISGGPLRTLAAMAVGGIQDMFDIQEQKSPLGRNIEGDEVGNTAAFLLSDMSSGITGELIHVDGGFNIIGV